MLIYDTCKKVVITLMKVIRPGLKVIKLFSCSTRLSMEFFLLIKVKIPTIVGILTSMRGKNSILGLSEPKKAEFLDSFILMSIYNFMLNSVEHEKSFIISGPGQFSNLPKVLVISTI